MDARNKIIHLYTTGQCLRDCLHCCNKQYDIDAVPYISTEEYQNANTILLTGGEPVIFTNPSSIALDIKARYPNIQNVYVYANAEELCYYMNHGGQLDGIDGFSISIKNQIDLDCFNNILSATPDLVNLKSNMVYYFEDLVPRYVDGFRYIHRVWQSKFVPADDSIFRRMNNGDNICLMNK